MEKKNKILIFAVSLLLDENKRQLNWDDMTKREISKLFEDRKIRTVWDDKEEKWYFSIVDVVALLTDSADPKQYIKRMKSRDEGLKANWGTICTLVPLVSEDGKKHKEMTADTTGIFRVIQSIPSHKAEPIKQWIAHVAAERIDQMQDPELSIQQAMMDYKRLGYSDNWINQRLKSIEIRKDLTDQWKLHNVEEGRINNRCKSMQCCNFTLPLS